jgi:hypothetical protein
MLELLRFLTLIWAGIGTVLSGQRSASEAFNRFYADFTMANIPEDLAYIRSQTDFIASELTAVDTGLAAISGKADAIIALLGGGVQDVLDAIAALPAGSDLVIPTAADNAAGVWGYLGVGWQQFAGTYLRSAGALAINANLAVSYPLSWDPIWMVYGQWDSDNPNLNVYNSPAPDWSDLIVGETRLAWLQRTDPGNNWGDGTGRGDPFMLAAPPQTVWKIAPGFSEGEFQALARTISDLRPSAPIWPGVAGVTLGTTVPCAASTVLELAMDGLLILITSYPATRARWGAPPYLSVYHTGRLAFITDNGDVEEFQYMGWTNAIYTPRSMQRAAGVVIFLEPNVEAAATPWDIAT